MGWRRDLYNADRKHYQITKLVVLVTVPVVLFGGLLALGLLGLLVRAVAQNPLVAVLGLLMLISFAVLVGCGAWLLVRWGSRPNPEALQRTPPPPPPMVQQPMDWMALAAAHQRQQEEVARSQAADAEQRRVWRLEGLVQRFGPEVGPRLAAGDVWQGQTEEQLVAALGRPLDVEERVLKSARRVAFKYDRIAKGKYGRHIILENGIVVGWKT